MTAQLEHALIIVQTNRYMIGVVEREQGHADIVGDGELSLMIDDLRALVGKIGVKAEEVANHLRATLETSEDLPAVVIYDADGCEVDSSERAS